MGRFFYILMKSLGMTSDFGYIIGLIIELVIVGIVAGIIAEKKGKDSEKVVKTTIIIVLVIEIFWWIIQ